MPKDIKNKLFKMSFSTGLPGLPGLVDVQVTFRNSDSKSMRSWLLTSSGKRNLHGVLDKACNGLFSALNSKRLKNE